MVNNEAPLLELSGIAKSFGACVANRSVHLKVKKGSIHAIIGENGAGKSTAMKIVYGLYRPDSGTISYAGKLCEWHSPRDALDAGIGMVHQHFMLADTHTVLENIILGTERFPFFPYSRQGARRKLQAIMERFGLHVDLDAPIDSLSVGLEQRVEILKLLYRDSELLILDEPTAVLSPQEIHALFTCLRALANNGKTVLVITHKLKEVVAYTDRVTVFRTGEVVGEVETKSTNVDELAELMVGKKIAPSNDHSAHSRSSRKALEVKLEGINFDLYEGEILGIAGVEGNGQSELLHSLLLTKKMAGSLRYFGQDSEAISAHDLRELGVGVFAEDRLREALLVESDLLENLILGYQRRTEFQKAGVFHQRALRSHGDKLLREFDVRPPVLATLAGRLSGGNQQKLVVARELAWRPRLLLAAQPTRGVDVLAIHFIHEKIRELRAQGSAVLLISSELDELMKLSDRIVVLSKGKLVREFPRGSYNEQEIGLAMGGA